MIGSITLLLSAAEIAEADDIGRARHRVGRCRPDKYRLDSQRYGLAYDILGARGEKAFAVCYPHLRWDRRIGGCVHNSIDFFPDIDVKSIGEDHKGLMVAMDDDASWRYVLADGTAHPVWKLLGWAWGHEVQLQRFLRKNLRYPTYIMPRELVRPMTEFIAN